MLSNRYFAALAFVGFLMAASAGGSSPAAAQGCGPWNNWCMPQCGDWNNWCAQECGPWNNFCFAQCGAWNNWCRGVCGPWNGYCAQQAYGPGPGWAHRFTNFHPIVADFLSDEMAAMHQKKLQIPEPLWQKTWQLGCATMSRPGWRLRDGRPLQSGEPIEPTA